MPNRAEQYLSLAKINQDNYTKGRTEAEKNDLFREILSNGVHGFCFGLYENANKEDDTISEKQIRRKLDILTPHTSWIRSFSCTNGNEQIPKIAKESGMKTLAGARLGSNPENNEKEIETLIFLAKEGLVDIAAVGNETVSRAELSEKEVIHFINRVKKEVPEIQVGYADRYDQFSVSPAITDACDVILANCFPVFTNCTIENSLHCLKEMYTEAKNSANGKPVIISATGWSGKDNETDKAFSVREDALDYFINTQLWCMDENIECFYFSSFDEPEKLASEQKESHWGIWNRHEKLKY